MLVSEARELLLVHAERLSLLERLDRRRAARLLADESHLAEALSRPAYTDHRLVAERRHHTDRKVALGDEVERVGRVAAVEHDLAPPKAPPAGELDQALHGLVGNALQQLPLHTPILRHLVGICNAESPPPGAGSRVPQAVGRSSGSARSARAWAPPVRLGRR